MTQALHRRLDRFERRAFPRGLAAVELWDQAPGGDAFTCAARPGEVRTAADFDADPAPEAAHRVILTNFCPGGVP